MPRTRDNFGMRWPKAWQERNQLKARVAELERDVQYWTDEAAKYAESAEARNEKIACVVERLAKAEKVIEAARKVDDSPFEDLPVALHVLSDALAEYDEAPDPGAVDGA